MKPQVLWTYPGSYEARVLVEKGVVVSSTHSGVPVGTKVSVAAKILRACGWRLPRRAKAGYGVRGGRIEHDIWYDANGRSVPPAKTKR